MAFTQQQYRQKNLDSFFMAKRNNQDLLFFYVSQECISRKENVGLSFPLKQLCIVEIIKCFNQYIFSIFSNKDFFLNLDFLLYFFIIFYHILNKKNHQLFGDKDESCLFIIKKFYQC